MKGEYMGQDGMTYQAEVVRRDKDGYHCWPIDSSNPDFPAAVAALGEMLDEPTPVGLREAARHLLDWVDAARSELADLDDGDLVELDACRGELRAALREMVEREETCGGCRFYEPIVRQYETRHECWHEPGESITRKVTREAGAVPRACAGKEAGRRYERGEGE